MGTSSSGAEPARRAHGRALNGARALPERSAGSPGLNGARALQALNGARVLQALNGSRAHPALQPLDHQPPRCRTPRLREGLRMERRMSVLGMFAILGLGVLMSSDQAIKPRVIAWDSIEVSQVQSASPADTHPPRIVGATSNAHVRPRRSRQNRSVRLTPREPPPRSRRRPRGHRRCR